MSWDAVALEEKLARLPPAQPCPACPSRDGKGRLLLVHPVLDVRVVSGRETDFALFTCTLCGAERSAPTE